MTRVRVNAAAPFVRLAIMLVAGVAFFSHPSFAENKLEKLVIQSASGLLSFKVEVARTPDERARGLMYRKAMPVNQGMLFDFEHEQLIMMWMKNTFLPLDMLFIDKLGRILKVARKTKPLSLDVIESGRRVLAVLELNGGIADRLGIRRGDLVRHPLFAKAQ